MLLHCYTVFVAVLLLLFVLLLELLQCDRSLILICPFHLILRFIMEFLMRPATLWSCTFSHFPWHLPPCCAACFLLALYQHATKTYQRLSDAAAKKPQEQTTFSMGIHESLSLTHQHAHTHTLGQKRIYLWLQLAYTFNI